MYYHIYIDKFEIYFWIYIYRFMDSWIHGFHGFKEFYSEKYIQLYP